MELEGIVDMARCLLIDEDTAERQRLLPMLSGLGLETAQAAAAEDALKYCNDNAPDVVMMAAGHNGSRPRDLVTRLRRARHGKRPVVILYAESPDTDMIGQSILQGAADVLMKPFDRELLQFKLKQAGIL
jgi:two-component system chemotaxis response regulator CheY